MLKIAKECDRKEIELFCKDNVFGVYVSCRIKAYGFESEFSKLWCGKNEDNEMVAVVSSLGGNAVIIAKNGCDYEELSFMISAFGFNSVLTDYETGKKCKIEGVQKKEVFCFVNRDNENRKTESEPDLKWIYELFGSCFPDSYQDDKYSYLSWLSDFMFRKNRSLARIKAINVDGKAVSAALTSAECETSAVISSVACRKEYRNQGYGRQVLLSLANELKTEGKSVFVISENTSVSEFYRKNGFKNCGFAAYTERHNNV